MIQIGSKIKKLRKEHKLTQAQLAERIGVTKPTVSAYENDSRSPSYEVLVSIANVFNVSLDHLLLDRYDAVLKINGLNEEQLSIIKTLIKSFQDSNIIQNEMLKTLECLESEKNYSTKTSEKH